MLFADATEIIDSGQLPDFLLRALGVRSGVGSDLGPHEQLAFFLTGKRLLLIIDHVHQIAGVYSYLRQLLTDTRTPTLKCITTSAVWDDETVFEVRPLPVPPQSAGGKTTTAAEIASNDAVRLFCDRAVQAQNEFSLTDTNAADVASLARRTDGIPLVVVLTAARVRHRTPKQIAAEGPDITIGKAIDATVQLLPLEVRRIFPKLATFHGGCDLAAAQAICTARLHDGGDGGTGAAACPAEVV